MLEVRELHTKTSPSLRHGAEAGREAEHDGKRSLGVDKVKRSPRFGTVYNAAALREQAHHLAHKILGRHQIHLHDGLEHNGLGLAACFVEAHGRACLEGEGSGRKLVVLYAHERYAYVHAFSGGIVLGYPCVDIGVSLVRIEYDELTATPFAFEACASMGFDEACRKAEPVML
ncbi:MAG TPA: hypothetical protein DCG47_00055, partial [Spirochaetaceae bacterium]|nr:hypothetical protein [Spirochaetaceae bacterium]